MIARAASPPDITAARTRRVTRAVITGVVVALVMTALAFVVRARSGVVIDADARAIRWATGITRRSNGFRDGLLVWQWLFLPRMVYAVGTLCCLWVWRRRGLTTRASWAFVTMMVGWTLATTAKAVVHRARPVVEDPIEHAPGYSFPSGHVANTACAVTATVILLWPLLGAVGRRLAVAIGAALILLTCADRVFLGVHYPSDCVGGIVLGCGLVLASSAGYRDWNPTRKGP